MKQEAEVLISTFRVAGKRINMNREETIDACGKLLRFFADTVLSVQDDLLKKVDDRLEEPVSAYEVALLKERADGVNTAVKEIIARLGKDTDRLVDGVIGLPGDGNDKKRGRRNERAREVVPGGH